MKKRSIKSDLSRIDRMRDTDIDYSDIPPLDKSFLKKATTLWPPVKKQLTIRIDADILAWLRAQGKGYQTRINRILRVLDGEPAEQREVIMIKSLFHVNVNCSNFERSLRFYKMLGFKVALDIPGSRQIGSRRVGNWARFGTSVRSRAPRS